MNLQPGLFHALFIVCPKTEFILSAVLFATNIEWKTETNKII